MGLRRRAPACGAPSKQAPPCERLSFGAARLGVGPDRPAGKRHMLCAAAPRTKGGCARAPRSRRVRVLRGSTVVGVPAHGGACPPRAWL